jgi:hypothetical protein
MHSPPPDAQAPFVAATFAATPAVVALLAVVAILAAGSTARAERDAVASLDALHARAAADRAAGRPIVVEVHVPLCDNRVLACGNVRLGDGDHPDRNLYWGTSGGFLGWFGRRGSGWREVARLAPEGEQLDGRVWRRTVPARGALRRYGARRPVEIYVIARAWRGTSIRRAMDAYAADLFADRARPLVLPDGRTLLGGGAAHVVAFVGHNGWMDVADFEWPPATARAIKGTMAIACLTEDYLASVFARSDSAVPPVPLLLTRSLLFAGAHGFEGAVTAFARGGSLVAVHDGAADAYARGQARPFARARAAFTNPASRLWRGLTPAPR